MNTATFTIDDVLHVARLDADGGGDGLGGARQRVQAQCLGSLFICQLSLGTVAGLLKMCCPATILWTVRAVVVSAVKGHVGRFFLQVGNKILNVMPPFTHGNSSSAVSLVLGAVRRVATLHHRMPRWIKCVVPKTVLTVDQGGGSDPLQRVVHNKRISMLVPPEIVLTAPTTRQEWGFAVTYCASFHGARIARKCSFDKLKGVARG